MIPPPSTSKPRSRLLIALGASAIVACLILTGLVARMDQWLYDRLGPLVSQEADNRIVVVAIDEKSLGELGRWPWSRRQHARLIDELGRIGVRGIGLDLLLSEPALFDPEGDALLARAMSRHGKVVLPVLAEATQANGPLVELLPIPEFSASVASLGHVDLAADDDGVVRSAYLRAGQGSPRWPALALALSQLDQPLAQNDDLPGERLSDQDQASPQRWVRDHRVLVPYASPPGGFAQVSYTDVIHQRVPASLLQGRWVLVGTTAMGMGDTVNVPGQRGGRGLTGVEYEANVLNMLIQGTAITPMSLLLLDIDHFKQLKDSQGHASGDAVLRLLARVLRGGFRQ